MSQINDNKKYFDALAKYKTHENKLDVTKPIVPPSVAIALKNVTNDKFATIGSLGDFSLWTGKAKAGKSYAMRMAVVAALSNSNTLHLGRFKSELPDNKSEVLYIDTEQSFYHLQLGVKRICKSLNVSNPEKLHVYGFRGTNENELLEIVEALIYTTKNVGLVIIDGIVDLTNGDLNAQADAKFIGTTLLRWTKECHVHAMAVLHENKSKMDNTAGGALGHWLTKKAESVMNVSISKDNDSIKIIESQETRNKPAETFYFSINEDGDAEVSDAPVKAVSTRNRAVKAELLNEARQVEIVKEVFSTALNAQDSIDSILNYFVKNCGDEIQTGQIALRRYLNHLVAHDYLNKRKGTGDDVKSIFYELTKRVKAMKVVKRD